MPKYFLIIGISINPPSYERIQSDPISGLHQRPDNISIPSTPSSSSSSFISSSYPTPVSEEVPQEVRYPPSFQHSHPTVLKHYHKWSRVQRAIVYHHRGHQDSKGSNISAIHSQTILPTSLSLMAVSKRTLLLHKLGAVNHFNPSPVLTVPARVLPSYLKAFHTQHLCR